MNVTVTELRGCQLLCSSAPGGRLGPLAVGRGSAEEETPGSHLRPTAWCRLHPPAAARGPLVRPRPLLDRHTSAAQRRAIMRILRLLLHSLLPLSSVSYPLTFPSWLSKKLNAAHIYFLVVPLHPWRRRWHRSALCRCFATLFYRLPP